jgi:hypothetical protein
LTLLSNYNKSLTGPYQQSLEANALASHSNSASLLSQDAKLLQEAEELALLLRRGLLAPSLSLLSQWLSAPERWYESMISDMAALFGEAASFSICP